MNAEQKSQTEIKVEMQLSYIVHISWLQMKFRSEIPAGKAPEAVWKAEVKIDVTPITETEGSWREATSQLLFCGHARIVSIFLSQEEPPASHRRGCTCIRNPRDRLLVP